MPFLPVQKSLSFPATKPVLTSWQNRAASRQNVCKPCRIVRHNSLQPIQVAVTLSGFLGSAFAADHFSEALVQLLVSWGVAIPQATLQTISVVLITILLSFLTLVFGELVPKRIAMRKAESIALGISGMIQVLAKLCSPLVWLLTAATNGVLRLFRIDPNAEEEEISEENIRMMADAGSEKGVIAAEENEMISKTSLPLTTGQRKKS